MAASLKAQRIVLDYCDNSITEAPAAHPFEQLEISAI